MTVSATDLREFGSRLLAAAGASADAASATAAQLVAAELRGHGSHGVRLVPDYTERLRDGRLDGSAEPEIVEDSGSTVVVDAHAALGQVAGPWLATLAAARAREHGVAVVAVRRCGHLGRLFDLAEAMARAGAIGLVFANDAGRNAVVAPYGGSAPRLATNPLAVGIPRRQPPHLVLDMATSATSHGSILVNRDAGRVDAPDTTDGDVLLPAAGAKGFGLALVTEILSGALTGAGHAGAEAAVDYQGILIVAIDIEHFVPRTDLIDRVEQVIARVKDGNPGVRVPGETGAAAEAAAAERVTVSATTWAKLSALAAENGIEIPPTEEE